MGVTEHPIAGLNEREYLLGAAEEERQRLLGQGELFAPEAAELFDRIGVEPGWRVADIGCGPLGVLGLLSARVGSTGTVVAVERDPRMLAYLRANLTEAQIPDVTVVEADATATGLPSDSLDLAHARFVLINVYDPQAVLAEMMRVTRPGGVLVCQDADLAGMTCIPAHPAWDLLLELILKTWLDGRDPFVGRRLPTLLHEAGAAEIDADCFVRMLRAGQPNFDLGLFFANVLRERILEAELTKADELDRAIADYAEHLARPGVVVQNPTIYQTWGRRPV